MTTQDTTSPAYHYGQRVKLKVKTYPVLQRAVEEGVTYGHTRAFKYSATPSAGHIVETIVDAVMAQVCEWFDFEEQA